MPRTHARAKPFDKLRTGPSTSSGQASRCPGFTSMRSAIPGFALRGQPRLRLDPPPTTCVDPPESAHASRHIRSKRFRQRPAPVALERDRGARARHRGEALVRLAGGAADRVFALIAKYGIDCAARQCGWIQPAHSAAAAQTIFARARQWSARRAPVDRRAGALQPLSYVRGLARAAITQGARIHTRSAVTRIVHEKEEWVAASAHGEARVRQVVLATDAYSGALWPEIVTNQLIVTSVQTATAPLPEALRRTILPGGTVASDTRKLLYYFRLDDEGNSIKACGYPRRR